MFVNSCSTNATHAVCKMGCVEHSDCNGFTMSYREISCNFESMSQSVTVIEQCSLAALAFVSRNNVGLDLCTACHTINKRQRREIFARNKVILRHLTKTTTHLALRQSSQCVHFAGDTVRLPKSANKILALSNIHTCLTANCSVNHCQKRCCNMYYCNATVIRGSSKTCNICDHSPAHTDNNISSREASLGKLATEFFNRGQRLMCFTITDDVMRDRVPIEVWEILRRNTFLSHNGHSLCATRQHGCDT